MRLWELEGGDGDDVGIGYGGGAQPRQDAAEDQDHNNHHIAAQIGLPQQPAPDLVVNVEEHALNPQIPAVPAEPVLAREGPLVLRIGQLPPRAAALAQEVVAPNPQAARPRRPGQRLRHGARGPGAQAEERPAGGRHAVAAAARRQANLQAQVPRQVPQRRAPQPAVNHVAPPANGLDAANQLWVENFVRMALADEEDLVDWDSDDEEDVGAWQIPVR